MWSATCTLYTAYITNILQEIFTSLNVDHERINLNQFKDSSAKSYYNFTIIPVQPVVFEKMEWENISNGIFEMRSITAEDTNF